MKKEKFPTILFIVFAFIVIGLIINDIHEHPQITLTPGTDLFIPDSGTNSPPKYCYRWVDDNPPTLRFYIMNKGTQTAVSSIARVRYAFNGTRQDRVQDIPISEIPGGKKVLVSTTWNDQCTMENSCIIKLEADVTNLVVEINEGNNAATCQDPDPFGYPNDW